MAYWLVKSEVEDYPISQLKRDKKTLWTGVRNYQARNYLREMKVGDEVIYYHSNGEPSGVAGIAKIIKLAEPDPTQFDSKSDYFDEKATKDAPRWFCPTLGFVAEFAELLPLELLRNESKLSGMLLLQKGSRLSVMPVGEKEFKTVQRLASR